MKQTNTPAFGAPFLPVTRQEMLDRGWEQPDFVYVSGDAYVDHPSFGMSIITRVLENAGYRVCVLAQPDWHNCNDFKRFGKPAIGFLVGAGVIDSMVNHYTAAKKTRSEDAYSPGGKAGSRPDRATVVYCNRIREAYRDVPIGIGGVEASLRRFAHYDYWDDRVRNSILVDSGADVLMFGMGERIVLEVAEWMKDGLPWADCRIPGTCVLLREPAPEAIMIESMEETAADKKAYARAFKVQYDQQDPVRGRPICQKHGKNFLLQNKPAMPLTQAELDATYALPYARTWHPMYDEAGGIPALEEVQFSIASVRGCFGACNFCALTFHQGRIVSSRSKESIVAEGELITQLPGFKGYIHDVGGPTADFRKPACQKQLKSGACKNRQCLYPSPCPNMEADHREYIDILRTLRTLPKVKKVFVRSGIRFDYVLADKKSNFMDELVKHHVSGQLKVAPEHVSPNALKYMGKPESSVFDRFVQKYYEANKRAGMNQYLVPYFMSSHPGCTLQDAVLLAEYMKKNNLRPEQVQDFYPTPGTLSTAMFYTGLDPRDMKPVYVPKDPHEKAMQRALMQYFRPERRALAREALRAAGREDLIGFGRDCLLPPYDRRPDDRRGQQGRNDDHRKPSGKGDTRRPGSRGERPSGGGRNERSDRKPGKRVERRDERRTAPKHGNDRRNDRFDPRGGKGKKHR